MPHCTDSTPSAPSVTPRRAVDDIELTWESSHVAKHRYNRLPQPSQERLDASLTDHALESTTFSPSELSDAEAKGRTILYLAYGSNLCSETFRGVRGIRPLSQINVVVPELRLTFDLPGLPYLEPCFANTAQRDPKQVLPREVGSHEYHKDRWRKGVVGCVYEVTLKDYAKIIATEGGGASYKDILVNCYPLPQSETVPASPSTKSFKAHTLFAPASDPSQMSYARPDPSYAQPSARYLKLITDGARELALPIEYQKYLQDIRPYTNTTKRQTLGKVGFMAIWMPFFVLFLGLTGRLKDENGKSPKWLATLMGWMFHAAWWNYDTFWKRFCGDGERTIGDTKDNWSRWKAGDEQETIWEEKTPLLD